LKCPDLEAVYLYILEHGCLYSLKHGCIGQSIKQRQYLIKVPKVIPIPGKIVQRNFPPGNKRRKLGENGFRAFLVEPDAAKKVCNCGWAPHLGIHY
jgi:hypothetical protein